MLARRFRINKEKDFKIIFKQGKATFSPLLKLKVLENNLRISRFAVVISNKISKKATVRNRLKRQITEIIRVNLPKLRQGFDIVIVVKQVILEKDFKGIEKVLLQSLKRAKVFK